LSDYTENFERFWKVYPARNGRKNGKKPAFGQWKKLTADQKRAAYADVEKRNRQQGWGKYVGQAISHGMPEASEPERNITWQERLCNRLFKSYVLAAQGLPEVKTALSIKQHILNVEASAFDEDIQSGAETKVSAVETLAGLFVGRLDSAYDKRLKATVLQTAKRR
jgi:hypothetical protein